MRWRRHRRSSPTSLAWAAVAPPARKASSGSAGPCRGNQVRRIRPQGPAEPEDVAPGHADRMPRNSSQDELTGPPAPPPACVACTPAQTPAPPRTDCAPDTVAARGRHAPCRHAPPDPRDRTRAGRGRNNPGLARTQTHNALRRAAKRRALRGPEPCGGSSPRAAPAGAWSPRTCGARVARSTRRARGQRPAPRRPPGRRGRGASRHGATLRALRRAGRDAARRAGPEPTGRSAATAAHLA
jgi:hypothetical protein